MRTKLNYWTIRRAIESSPHQRNVPNHIQYRRASLHPLTEAYDKLCAQAQIRIGGDPISIQHPEYSSAPNPPADASLKEMPLKQDAAMMEAVATPTSAAHVAGNKHTADRYHSGVTLRIKHRIGHRESKPWLPSK